MRQGISYLPGCEAGRAEQVSAWLDADVLVVLGTDLAELEGGAHLTVELVLLLGDLDVVLRGVVDQVAQVRVHRQTIGIEVTVATQSNGIKNINTLAYN